MLVHDIITDDIIKMHIIYAGQSVIMCLMSKDKNSS